MCGCALPLLARWSVVWSVVRRRAPLRCTDKVRLRQPWPRDKSHSVVWGASTGIPFVLLLLSRRRREAPPPPRAAPAGRPPLSGSRAARRPLAGRGRHGPGPRGCPLRPMDTKGTPAGSRALGVAASGDPPGRGRAAAQGDRRREGRGPCFASAGTFSRGSRDSRPARRKAPGRGPVSLADLPEKWARCAGRFLLPLPLPPRPSQGLCGLGGRGPETALDAGRRRHFDSPAGNVVDSRHA